MEKNIRDYLHLYPGAGCTYDNDHTKDLVGVVTPKIIEWGMYGDTYSTVRNVRLHLRPLSDMAEEELKEVAAICYEDVFDHKPKVEGVESIADEYGGGLKCYETIDGKRWEYGLTISDEGIMFSANGDFLNVAPYKHFHYLLSKHFDLFGLIESGLAIDKTKQSIK